MCNSSKWVVHQNIGISDIILGHFQTLAKVSQENLHLSARVLYEGKVTESLVKAAGKPMSQLVHNFKSFSTGTWLCGQSNHPHTPPVNALWQKNHQWHLYRPARSSGLISMASNMLIKCQCDLHQSPLLCVAPALTDILIIDYTFAHQYIGLFDREHTHAGDLIPSY